uniref:Uncharacterized protein n=1 Tax=Aegilops tauschii subsp. strangulata TaxID=200361 RepID=A0A453DTJ9_AEGTS
MQRFYLYYYENFIKTFQNKIDKSDRGLLTKSFQTEAVLFEVLKQVNRIHNVEVDRAVHNCGFTVIWRYCSLLSLFIAKQRIFNLYCMSHRFWKRTVKLRKRGNCILLNSQTIDDGLFYRETNFLMSVKRQNIVRFLGYCANAENIAFKVNGSGKCGKYLYPEIRERLLCF